jgi:hypothetical protein
MNSQSQNSGDVSSHAAPSSEPSGPGYDRGTVLWHSSEEDGGPDVGIQVGLGEGWTLYFGELAEATLEDHGIGEELRASWWAVLWGPKTERVLGAVPDTYEAREAAEEIAARLRP